MTTLAVEPQTGETVTPEEFASLLPTVRQPVGAIKIFGRFDKIRPRGWNTEF